MTVCNMSIEAGPEPAWSHPTRRPSRTWRGAGSRPRAQPGSEPSAVAGAALRRGCDLRPRARGRRRASSPAGDVGHEPEHGRPVTGQVPIPADIADPDDRSSVERALAYMGLEPGTRSRTSGSIASSSGRARTRGSRTCARRGGRAGRRVHPVRAGDGRPGLGEREARGRRRRGSTGSSRTPASSGARRAARCASA